MFFAGFQHDTEVRHDCDPFKLFRPNDGRKPCTCNGRVRNKGLSVTFNYAGAALSLRTLPKSGLMRGEVESGNLLNCA